MPIPNIREYSPKDAAALRRCIVELQEFERTIDPKLPPGEEMADGYLASIHARCREANGKIFVAELDDSVVGFAAVLAQEKFTEPDEPLGTYAFISDLVVLSQYRRHGIGRQLLDHAEAFARAAGAREIRIGVLALNMAARKLYRSAEFMPHLEVFVKRW